MAIANPCRQCEHPPCVDGCFAGALVAEPALGSVSLDEERCVGCRACVLECPFGAMVMARRPDGSERATKQDDCAADHGGGHPADLRRSRVRRLYICHARGD